MRHLGNNTTTILTSILLILCLLDIGLIAILTAVHYLKQQYREVWVDEGHSIKF